MISKIEKQITLRVNEDVLELIDKASEKEFCSRSNFLVRHAVKSAREIIGEN